MTQSSIKYFFASPARYGTLIVFSFFLFEFVVGSFLYAEMVIKEVSADAEAGKVVWAEEDGKLNIKETGDLRKGDVLSSEGCRICVSKGEIVVEKDGQEIKIGPGQFLDAKETQPQKDLTSYVKEAQGEGEYQPKLQEGGKSKPLGNPIVVGKDEVLLKKNECFEFVKMSTAEFEELQTYGSIAKADVPALPGSEPGSEQAIECASAPC